MPVNPPSLSLKLLCPLSLLIVLTGVLTVSVRADVPLRINMKSAIDMTISPVDDQPGTYDIQTQGVDPRVLTQPFGGDANLRKDSVVEFEYFCPNGVSPFQIFLGPNVSVSTLVSDGALPSAELWMPYSVDLNSKLPKNVEDYHYLRLDFGAKPDVGLRVRNLRLRAPNPEEQEKAERQRREWGEKLARAERYVEYLERKYLAQVEAVSCDTDEVEIRGKTSVALGEDPLFLAEFALWQSPWEAPLPKPVSLTPIYNRQNFGAFELSLPRWREQDSSGVSDASAPHDRLYSCWAVVRRNVSGELELLSHAEYATELDIAPADAPLEMIPASKKGLGGAFWHSDELMEEFIDQGNHSTTVNVKLTSLFAKQGQPAIEHVVDGVTWRFRASEVAIYDRVIKYCTDHDVVVAAILLLPMSAQSDDLSRPDSVMLHPEATKPGLYAMPNLTSPEGVKAYEAVMDFLASRYGRPDEKYGLISNWIMHNEVDFAWSWTNMGHQPMPLYMDMYTRSMRCVWLTAQKYNPHARVFISLTHRWTAPANEDGTIYQVRELLEMLVLQSRVEGDFGWGIAYHPYPQSLLKPDTWNDKDAMFGFDTRYITPKNIEVLDAWLHRPENLYQGEKLRGVLLSEQGFHTPDYSEESQRVQAAGYVYIWHKIQDLDSIETFQNHRWIDHPLEGGLKVGMRTLPSPEHPDGERKFGWYVYRALGTSNEAQETEFAKEIIGVDDLDDIPYRGTIR